MAAVITNMNRVLYNIFLLKHNFKLVFTLLMVTGVITKCSSQRIGIIGAGIGGTASAYFLRELMPNADIDIFESGDVGGRLALVNISGHEYEAGGALIHPRNLYMQRLVKQLGLKHRKQQKLGRMGLYNGRDFVFTESGSGMLSTIKLMWRYGLSLWNMDSTTKERLASFGRIYDLQGKGQSYQTVADLLQAMSADFVTSTQTSARTGFLKSGMSELLVDELATAALRFNYGQSVDLAHEFVGFVSIAGAEKGLWSVEGGNKQVPFKLLQSSKSMLIKSKVREVRVQQSGRGYDLIWLEMGNEERSGSYDAIIVATPLTSDYNGGVILPKLTTPQPDRHMHKLYGTYIQGVLNYTNFGLTAADGIDDIIPLWENPIFDSISFIKPVDGSEPNAAEASVYKVFSPAPLSLEELSSIFLRLDVIVARDWYPFPKYSYKEPLVGSFVLNDGLFYLNAIEWAASAMEMSCIGAKNVALLTREFLDPCVKSKYETTTLAETKNEL